MLVGFLGQSTKILIGGSRQQSSSFWECKKAMVR